MRSLPVHRSIFVIDLEKSTVRTNPVKAELRHQVYRMLNLALACSGVEPGFLDPFEDRGDGVLALIHPVDDVPKTRLLSRLVPEFVQMLDDYNRALPPAELPVRGMRVRVVLHAGEVHRDENGYFGEAVDVACRLLDAPRLKKCLSESIAPLVLVVSEDIYWSIVKHGYDGIRADSYRPGLRVHVAGRRRQGWIHLPTRTPGEEDACPSVA
ncbi:hypothetical protein [Actinomadura rubrisoli]|uniref:Guanylate cyclase domain-containing protein n=1 Tax=Actinomadura rubrisoli TaxID=2530368 RepID=A0A4R4ZSB3_9ACTN|nr:hypothetical protein [Actinomadura rubrisoli]TDD61958.1 hypothetical protein E1298_44995 [Actinomadura rubrisoli]